MKRSLFVVISVVSLFIPSCASISSSKSMASSTIARDEQYTKQYSECIDKSGGVTATMLDCIATETKIQDTRLNNVYKKLIDRLSSERKKRLITAQRLWVQYRDANCSFYEDPESGTVATLSGTDCFLNMTASRDRELNKFTAE
jgi:uncharacterized protein YecT (DUF1311 family)